MAALEEPSSASKEDSTKVAEKDNIPGEIGDVLTTITEVHTGMKLEAKDAYGKWYMAKVLDIDQDDGRVLVHFDRWNSRYDEYIELSSGRLRYLLTERRAALERERDWARKFGVGDMVQARWEDGRMYFGKVLKLGKDMMVDVLFDDGVHYRAPLSEVRKRNLSSRSNLSRNSLSDSSPTPGKSRSSRAKKRCVSNSQSPETSDSKPVKKKHRRRLYSDSSCCDSDVEMDETKASRKRKPLISASSDSEGSGISLVSKKLRKSSNEPSTSQLLSPVKESKSMEESKSIIIGSGEEEPASVVTTEPVKRRRERSKHPRSPKPLRRSTRARSASKQECKLATGRERVATRTRPHNKLDNVSKGMKQLDKKPVKVAPKEMVIVWDHNEFKCKVTGCNKSFRKETLLQSHIKHYHTKQPPKQKPPGKGALKKETQSPPEQLSGDPPTPLTPAESADQAPGSPSREPGGKEEAEKPFEDSVSPDQATVKQPSPPAAVSGKPGFEDDTVRCVCGDLTDEGFMIQCEHCLCWQHGDCVSVNKHSAPEKYICSFCTNPPGLRSRFKHKFDEGWFGEGSLPSLPGGPQFPQSGLVKELHMMTDNLHKLRNILHSSKMKLQAAGRVSHPYMRQWGKEISHHSKEEMAAYLINALMPISFLTKSPTNGNTGNFHNGSFSSPTLPPLEPLPHSSPSVEAASNGSSGEQPVTPDPSTLKLDPLPPLNTERETQVSTPVKVEPVSTIQPVEEVSVYEFALAFVNGDSTNWYHRMKLLDHIEAIQDRVGQWMDSIDSQLDDLPDDAESADNVADLLDSVQSTMAELKELHSLTIAT